MVRNRYSWLFFTSEDRICSNLTRQIWRHNANTPRLRDVTNQLWWSHNAKSEKTVLSVNGEISDRLFFSDIVCSEHKLACTKQNDTFVTVNHDFCVAGDATGQSFSLVTSSFVNIIANGKSPHSWPKIVNHGNYILLNIYISCFKVKEYKSWIIYWYQIFYIRWLIS